MFFVTNSPLECCACGACADICPQKAITLQPNEEGFYYPCIDANKCIHCKRCQQVCAFHQIHRPDNPTAFIAINNNETLYHLSSSGGIFSAIAKAILNKGGIVYGAALIEENGKLICRHIGIEEEKELPKLQGSKYVHSQTEGVFGDVKEQLKSGKTVLFSGTSCQVAALYSYLGKKYDGLFTIDLVCHGTPEIFLFQEYIEYLGRKSNKTITSFRFRNKDSKEFRKSNETYTMEVTYKDSANQNTTAYINKNLSSYFKLYLARAGYRPNCYKCPFSVISKPADLTLGDFCPSKLEAVQMELDPKLIYSTVLVQTATGEKMLAMINNMVDLTPISVETALEHHRNLKESSIISKEGVKMLEIYNKGGFDRLQRYVFLRYYLRKTKTSFKNLLKK